MLPAEHIQPAFKILRDNLPNDMDERVTALVTSVNDNWISSRLHRHQKKAHKQTQGLLSKYWASYAAGEITTAQLLRKCSYVYAPRLCSRLADIYF